MHGYLTAVRWPLCSLPALEGRRVVTRTITTQLCRQSYLHTHMSEGRSVPMCVATLM